MRKEEIVTVEGEGMGKLVLDESVRKALSELGGEVELCDESGRAVGYFLSPEAYERWLYTLAKAQILDAELADAREEYRKHGGLTTAQVLDRLRGLESGPIPPR
jgi:hypothetical protein